MNLRAAAYSVLRLTSLTAVGGRCCSNLRWTSIDVGTTEIVVVVVVDSG